MVSPPIKQPWFDPTDGFHTLDPPDLASGNQRWHGGINTCSARFYQYKRYIHTYINIIRFIYIYISYTFIIYILYTIYILIIYLYLYVIYICICKLYIYIYIYILWFDEHPFAIFWVFTRGFHVTHSLKSPVHEGHSGFHTIPPSCIDAQTDGLADRYINKLY